jgi:hypothetical protein
VAQAAVAILAAQAEPEQQVKDMAAEVGVIH